MKRLNKQHGVTLIELVVVMLIIGILTAIAVPSYRNYVLRSQRSDAKDALLALATAQEKFYLQCNRYATAIGAAPNCAGTGTLQGAAASKNGWYTLAVVAATATTFTVSAVATAGQAQFTDTACRTFLMTGAGLRTATNSGGADNTAECWR